MPHPYYFEQEMAVRDVVRNTGIRIPENGQDDDELGEEELFHQQVRKLCWRR